MSPVEFESSLLGTKDHWDQGYAQDLVNFHECGLEGEVWFGEEPEAKMVAWASTHVPPSTRPTVLDVGTGNGHLLFAMAEAGYDASRLAGVDYSKGSVDLAIAIARDKQRDSYDNITFAVCDFLDPASPISPPKEGGGAWDLVLDKGTYDAISLMEKNERGFTPLDKYVPRVVKLLRPGGHFLITSCNFTEDELKQNFTTSGLKFKESVPYEKFTFGGKTGSSYATVAFQKQSVFRG